jgi:medium-chain acyl-[acyl-carrier-protein] hydrolase
MIQMNAWLPYNAHTPRGALRLFCFPPGGAGAAVYRKWIPLLGPAVEVCPIEFPGRLARRDESVLSSLPELVERAALALGDELSPRFAFFGYSMGSLVAFELARLLRRERGLEPEWLFVAAHAAPQLARTAPPLSGAPDHELLDFFRRTYGPLPTQVTAHPELVAVIAEILRADVKLLERYHYAAEPPLGCPIRAFGGEEDGSTLPAELEAWQAHSTAQFALHMFPGGHFFWEDSLVDLVDVVSRCLLPEVRAGSARARPTTVAGGRVVPDPPLDVVRKISARR